MSYINKLTDYWNSNPTISRIIANTGWLTFARFIQMGLALFTSALVARHLGKESFGNLNYAISFVLLLGAFAPMGLNGILVRELTEKPASRGSLMGTATLIKIVGAFVSIATVFLVSFFTNTAETSSLVTVLTFILLFQFVGDLVDSSFQSLVKSKYFVYATLTSLFIVSFLQILFVLQAREIIWFAYARLAQTVLIAVFSLCVYFWYFGKEIQFKLDLHLLTSLLSKCWPLILSSVGAVVYMRLDQVMLREMINAEEVGIYAASVRLSEVWYFIPKYIMLSAFPALIKLREKGEEVFNSRVQQILNYISILSISLSIFVTLMSRWIVLVVYSEEFIESAVILAVHIWATLFIFMGELFSKWIIIENKYYLSPLRHLMGAIVNVLLNLILIPYLGGVGAAVATLISYAVATYLICFLVPSSRNLAKMMTKSLYNYPINVYRLIQSGLKALSQNM